MSLRIHCNITFIMLRNGRGFGSPDQRYIEQMDPRDATRLTALGQRLRTLRLARGLRADDLANSVAISRMTLYRLERGEPGIATGVLYRVLQALDVAGDVELLAARAPADAASCLRQRAPRCGPSPMWVSAERVRGAALRADPMRGFDDDFPSC